MRAVAVAFAALLLLPAAAQAKTIDVPQLFADVLPNVKAKTNVPVLLPQRYRSPTKDNFASGAGHKRSYALSIGAVEHCGGATACFVAEFGAKRGAKPDFKRKVRLRGGRTGYFKPLSCGASCSAPMIEWRRGGVLYWIQAHAGVTARQERRHLVKLANSALFHGPR
jgi:hypothetical protein